MCSCIKGIAHEQQQQAGWQWVAGTCSRMALACSALANLEAALHTAQQERQVQAEVALRDSWHQVYKGRVPLPESLVAMLQHAYGSRLVMLFNPVVLKLAADYSCQLKGEQLPAQMEPQHLQFDARILAAMLAYLPCMQGSSSSEVPSSRSQQSSSGAVTASSSSSSQAAAGTSQPTDSDETTRSSSISSGSGAVLSGAELEVQLACAVVARAVRLYSTVLQEVFDHPCLDEAASAEARAAGAAQLMHQVATAKRYNLLGPLPIELLEELDSRDEAILNDRITAAVIGALLGDQGELMEFARRGVSWFSGQLGRLKRSLQLSQDTVQQLQECTDDLQAALERAMRNWREFHELTARVSPADGSFDDQEASEAAAHAAAGSSDTAAGSPQIRAESDAERNTMIRQRTIICNSRSNWVYIGNWQAYGRLLYEAMQRWADAVCAALPSRRCCSNPCCVVLREMSESNLVSRKACCCGSCSVADQAVRYCSRDCQVSHWQQHKALCRSRRRQQQQKQKQGQEQQQQAQGH
jgi:hypothetical protein